MSTLSSYARGITKYSILGTKNNSARLRLAEGISPDREIGSFPGADGLSEKIQYIQHLGIGKKTL